MCRTIYSVKIVENLLTELGCKLVLDTPKRIDERIKVREEITYVDPGGHFNIKKLSKVLQGHIGCNECKKKYSIKEIKGLFESKGCQLLSEEYQHSKKQQLLFLCPKGHKNKTNLYNFDNRKYYDCEQCRKDKYIKEIIEVAEIRSCKIIKVEYENQNSIIEYICPNGHLCFQKAQYFLNGYDCLECSGRKKHSLEYIRGEFENKGCILLENSYINALTPMKYLCQCNRMDYKSWNDFQQGSYYCFNCRYERKDHHNKFTYKEVYEIFEKEGCKLLSKEYKNNTSYLGYQCKCGSYDAKTLQHFKRGQRCEGCTKEKLSGENNSQWKGGKSTLNAYLRKTIKPWVKESFVKHGTNCVISGEKADIIHHLYNFSRIVDETFEQLNLPIYGNSNEYTTEQLSQISNKLIELHYCYGLGVPLSSKIHKVLHSLYGNKVSLEDFKRFCKVYPIIKID